MVRYRLRLFFGILLSATALVAAPPPDPLAVEREAVWNSPDMLAARGWLIQYFAASKRHSARNAQRYFVRLHACTPEQMHAWLADLTRRRGEKIEYYRHQEAVKIAADVLTESQPTLGHSIIFSNGQHFPQAVSPKELFVPQTEKQEPSEENSLEKEELTNYTNFLHSQCLKFRALGLPCPTDPDEIERGPIGASPAQPAP